jgi:hypothetical protein
MNNHDCQARKAEGLTHGFTAVACYLGASRISIILTSKGTSVVYSGKERGFIVASVHWHGL